MPVATHYIADDQGRPFIAEARITVVGPQAGGTAPSVPNNSVHGHRGNQHPYHHERGHLIGRQLGGDGGDPRNLVGLSDGTNAPLMTDIENECRVIIEANPGVTLILRVTVDWSAAYYDAPQAAPHDGNMVGSILVQILDLDSAVIFERRYPNGVVNNHHVAGCC